MSVRGMQRSKRCIVPSVMVDILHIQLHETMYLTEEAGSRASLCLSSANMGTEDAVTINSGHGLRAHMEGRAERALVRYTEVVK